jgi:tetratricopeptide (TPR) repeat protein
MNGDEREAAEEQMLEMLAACDEALAGGMPPAVTGAETPAELRPRLERGLACIQLLREALADPAATAPLAVGTPETSSDPLQIREIGRFQIRHELGHGSCGIVFLAFDPQLRREVALKVPRGDALVSPQLRERLLREARAAAGLNHPNLVTVHEAGEIGPVCYIASEYCPGVSLAAWLKQAGEPVPFREAAALTAALADAVEHAHSRGIVHRDLKPANVLLQKESPPRYDEHKGEDKEEPQPSPVPSLCFLRLCGESFLPKITDFGLAKLLDADETGHTQSGAILGTPSYMAPEQASGKAKNVGPAADVYALGAILFELLTGRPPFRGESTLDTLEQVRSREPLPPRRLRPRTPRDLQTICLKCLEKEPGRRYRGAAALADDLRRFLANRPIQARPRGPAGRVLQWARRQPVVAGLTAVLLAAAVTLVAGGLRYHFGMRDALRQTDAQKRRAQENLHKALAAVDQLLTRVGDKKLAPVPQAEAVRKQLLQDALRFYEDLLAEQSDDPDLRRETAVAYRRLGQILEELMQSARAEQAYGESVTRLRDLAAAFPAEAAYRFDLGVSLMRHAAVHDLLDHTAEAEQGYREAADILARLADQSREPAYRKELGRTLVYLARVLTKVKRDEEAGGYLHRALALNRELVAEFPGDPVYRQELAATCSNLGNHLDAVGKKAEAIPWGEEAVQIMERLVAENPADPGLRYELAGWSMNLGIKFADLGKVRQAEDVYHRCQEHFRKLVADFPSTPQYQFYLGSLCTNLGHLLKREGRLPEAEQAYRERLALHEKLAAAFPEVAGYHYHFALGQYDLAKLCRVSQRLAEARAWVAGAVLHGARAPKMAPKILLYRVMHGEYHRYQADTLLDLGEHAAAVQSAVELTRILADQPIQYVTAAGFFARAAGLAEKDGQLPEGERTTVAKAYAGQALALVMEAVQKGYRDWKGLRTDANLAALRALPGFQERLAELEKTK